MGDGATSLATARMMEFDLPKRDNLINEACRAAFAARGSHISSRRRSFDHRPSHHALVPSSVTRRLLKICARRMNPLWIEFSVSSRATSPLKKPEMNRPFAFDLQSVNRNPHLSDRRIDEVDRRANQVDAF
jgi:hypothetical protein